MASRKGGILRGPVNGVPSPARSASSGVHIGEVPDLGELAVCEAIKSELRNSHPTTGRFNSLEGPPVGTGDREVPRDIVAVDDEVPYLPMPVRKCGEQRRELRRNRGWIHRDVVDLDGRCIK